MTETGRKLAEENHNLIYDFAKKKNLVLEEYYDLLAIGLCNAASSYSSENGSSFSTYAYHCMQNVVIDYWRKISLKKSVPEENMLCYSDLENEIFQNECTDAISVIDNVIGNVQYEYLLSILNTQERTLAQCLLNGLKGREIATIMNISERYVRQLKSKIQKKLRCYI